MFFLSDSQEIDKFSDLSQWLDVDLGTFKLKRGSEMSNEWKGPTDWGQWFLN